MDTNSGDSANPHSSEGSDVEPRVVTATAVDSSPRGSSSMLSTSAISSWAKGLKLPQPLAPATPNSQAGNAPKSAFSRLASGFGLNLPLKPNDSSGDSSAAAQSGVFESLTKGIVDSSFSAVKAVQVKARHIVSQNKRRYQEGGFDLDMTYITENIIAMGFPAGDMSSGFFGFVEGLYRNHMEEVIKFFETHHKGKYKVYNLCSERLYDASLFQGKVASFPFDDHNCPPIHLIKLFCQSAYSWLKEDILNVVVVHCKAGMARTGLMICSLLLFLKFFPTAEECIDYYNQKRCVDGKGLILPGQIRYVKYFERILTHFNGETPPGRRCMLRGFRLHKCPYWIRPAITISNHSGVLFSTKKHPKTKDLMPEDFWLRAAKKGIVVFALPGEPGLTELAGDFKIHFQDRQGDFYCWLNTTMMENRVLLDSSDLDGFDKRKLPSPGFQVEIVMIDYDGTISSKFKADQVAKGSDGRVGSQASSSDRNDANTAQVEVTPKRDNDDDVFSDSDGEGSVPSRRSVDNTSSAVGTTSPLESGSKDNQITSFTDQTKQLSLGSKESAPFQTNTSKETKFDVVERVDSIPNLGSGDIKAIAADASVFSFGDDEDYESE
ncbi:phosphatidylinositol 3,4,5-trisphosphate 3-phosphatase and protein-tyrosine-phosphatase PTEN2A-like isoform X2 [Coffea arabica]|uniref:Phosphatidylinositol 3,4,5-trisphosphate 3-phosphatase and protein-tyrosine-phosphatase PTEN2A-like isoform X2 n=1 Tax=Coffea arabica TaxID=13443 RepID=A0A6P6TIH6_COFAR|nr:phosphatidylinositol 3,4,5-trisphosphate 3-phosphatase and protein-tyrosine-phosphatase PTEN2A-like [Coffea arabica]